jgi:uncharacterized protein (TIGR02246 family)
MKRFLIAVAFLVLTGCATSDVEGLNAIAATNAEFEAEYNRGDAAGLAELYTADAILMAPNNGRIKGRRAIQGLWQRFFDAGVSDIDLKTLEVEMAGSKASEVGTFSLTAPDSKGGRVTGNGKFIVLWRRDTDGAWRLHRDIWNNDPAG